MNENALLTDQYELTMAASYFQHQMFADATFSLFIREYPANRAYFVSAGLEDVLRYLESFRFREEDLDHLDSIGLFSLEFLDYLSGLHFSGDVHAIPEGSPLRLPDWRAQWPALLIPDPCTDYRFLVPDYWLLNTEH